MQTPENTDEFDVIILGAGPAGCAAAIRARSAGLRVVMLDANVGPRTAPGETLHPGIEVLLEQLGVSEAVERSGFQRHRGVWMNTDGTRVFLPYGADERGPWLGFQADRRTLHRLLQQAAVDANVTLLRNCRPVRVLLGCRGRVLGVELEGRRLHATWTLDATGRSAWLARSLELPTQRCSPQLCARFGWRKDGAKELDGQPLFAFHLDGWDWIAPLGDDRAAWVELRVAVPGEPRPPGVDLTWTLRPSCAGPGFMLLGDAAGSLDPASSHGVLRALMSGIFASHLLAEQRRGAEEEAAIDAYRTWFRALFEHDSTRLRELYRDSQAGPRFLLASA